MQTNYEAEQLSMFGQDLWYGKMFPAPLVQERQRAKTSESFWRRSSALNAIPFQSLDLTPGAGNLLGEFYWELISPWRGGASTLNTGVSPREEKESSLWRILEDSVPQKYYLSPAICSRFLRLAQTTGCPPPEPVEYLLIKQGGRYPSSAPFRNGVCGVLQNQETSLLSSQVSDGQMNLFQLCWQKQSI